MELREWLPLVVSGVLGLAGIVAGLWGTLATLRAQRQRDERDAAERQAAAQRADREAQRRHLLEERRAAYAAFVAEALPLRAVILARSRRYFMDGYSKVRDLTEEDWSAVEHASASVQIVAPPEIGSSVRVLIAIMRLAWVRSTRSALARSGGDDDEEAAREAAGARVREKWDEVIRGMNADLFGRDDQSEAAENE